MSARFTLPVAFAVVTVLGGTSQTPVAQTSQSSGAKTRPGSRIAGPVTPDGHPDLQGTWSFATLTPFERRNPGDKQELSDTEVEEFVNQSLSAQNKDRRDGGAAAD